MLTETFDRALQYAARLHAAQTRKGASIPYVAHLLAVASLVLEHGGTELEAIAALLHDAIEDQPRDGATRREIEAAFGAPVLEIIEHCSDDVVGQARGRDSWRARKAEYHAKLRHAPRSARLVSAADKLHNARSVLSDLYAHGDSVWDRFNAGRRDSLWNYRELVAALRAADVDESLRRLVDELDRTVAAIHERVGVGAG